MANGDLSRLRKKAALTAIEERKQELISSPIAFERDLASFMLSGRREADAGEEVQDKEGTSLDMDGSQQLDTRGAHEAGNFDEPSDFDSLDEAEQKEPPPPAEQKKTPPPAEQKEPPPAEQKKTPPPAEQKTPPSPAEQKKTPPRPAEQKKTPPPADNGSLGLHNVETTFMLFLKNREAFERYLAKGSLPGAREATNEPPPITTGHRDKENVDPTSESRRQDKKLLEPRKPSVRATAGITSQYAEYETSGPAKKQAPGVSVGGKRGRGFLESQEVSSAEVKTRRRPKVQLRIGNVCIGTGHIAFDQPGDLVNNEPLGLSHYGVIVESIDEEEASRKVPKHYTSAEPAPGASSLTVGALPVTTDVIEWPKKYVEIVVPKRGKPRTVN